MTREFADGYGAVVAGQDQTAFGCVLIKPVEDDLCFGRLTVIPSAPGRGIARLLIEAVETGAIRRGLAGVRMSACTALPGRRTARTESVQIAEGQAVDLSRRTQLNCPGVALPT